MTDLLEFKTKTLREVIHSRTYNNSIWIEFFNIFSECPDPVITNQHSLKLW